MIRINNLPQAGFLVPWATRENLVADSLHSGYTGAPTFSVQDDMPPTMTQGTAATNAPDPGLESFLEGLPDHRRTTFRTLALAWVGSGQSIRPGTRVVRLTCTPNGSEVAYTVATLYAPSQQDLGARLELGRALLRNHGMEDDAWTHWSDELVDFPAFDATTKFPTISLDAVDAGRLARLVTALRDLALLAQGPSSED